MDGTMDSLQVIIKTIKVLNAINNYKPDIENFLRVNAIVYGQQVQVLVDSEAKCFTVLDTL
jgi:hypothetical protein